MPMIADMLGALAITKVPPLWGDAALYPKAGAGTLSVDAWMNRADAEPRVQTASV